MKRNFISGFLAGAMIFGAVGVLASQIVATQNPFRIELNGQEVDIEGYNINDNTYFKLRDIATAVGGFEVDFNDNTIQLSKDGYTYNHTSNTAQYSDYEAFSSMFEAQSTLLDDHLQACIDSTNYQDWEMLVATNESANALLQKAYDIANLYLINYSSDYAITTEELEAKARAEQNKFLNEAIANGDYVGDDSMMDRLTYASCYWDACRDVLKQYFYELYKYTGEVNVTLTVG